MIPNIIHFVFGLAPDFGGRPFMLFHYLAIKSAYEVNKPDKIYFVCAHEPEGEYFMRAKPYIEIIKVTPPDTIFGNPLNHYAHKADVIRIERIIQYGGIYLDLDVICSKPLTPFLSKDKLQIGSAYFYWQYEPKTLLRKLLYHLKIHRPSKQRKLQGLCNAVLIAPPGDPFLKRWYETYKNFRANGHDEYWDEQSVKVPALLAQVYRDEVDVLEDNYFFYPSFDFWSLKALFAENHSFEEAYLFHLWESLSYDTYLKNLTETDIMTLDTTYNKVARRFLTNTNQ